MSACMKLGEVDYACEAFDEIPDRNVAVWNAVITGCADNGHEEIAFAKFREMHELGVKHDNYSFACVLSLCSLELLEFGSECVGDAYKVFDDAEVRDEITINAMIDGLVGISRDEEALLMFREMQRSGLSPTKLTFVSLMSSCSFERNAAQLHVQAIKRGLESCTAVINAAITMYSRCGILEAAKTPNAYTLSIALAMCATLCSLGHAKQIHCYIIRNASLSEASLSNGLITVYSKCGVLDSCLRVFNKMPERDTVSWNALISAFAQHGKGKEAVNCFEAMRKESKCKPDLATFTALLSACSHSGLVNDGAHI
ncbi:pentatricopeptide repeat-containing protein At3g49740-like [Eucalyptus grandis]|uniref:pentatricopeptide repeat-containing protein At3g49740-like n=1 Tax=Eucalyptus grandis TaxID=71139 RepID=UPI00192ECFC4|nr:pentatricopeptide repeat-containing protein At3g49740-like [Eucalyptus grandis]